MAGQRKPRRRHRWQRQNCRLASARTTTHHRRRRGWRTAERLFEAVIDCRTRIEAVIDTPALLRRIDGRRKLTQRRRHHRAVGGGEVECRDERVQSRRSVASCSIECSAHLAAVGIGPITRIGIDWAGECQRVGIVALGCRARQQGWRLQRCRHVRERARQICCIQPSIRGNAKIVAIPATQGRDRERSVALPLTTRRLNAPISFTSTCKRPVEVCR